MEFNQDDKTKKFLQQAKTLVESGVEPTFKAVAERIDWHHNSLSLALKGKRNVPFDVFKRFQEIYKPEEIENKKADSEESAYKDKYIALIEQQLRDKDLMLAELKERMDSRTLHLTQLIESATRSIEKNQRTTSMALAFARSLWKVVQEHRANQEGVPLKQIRLGMDKILEDQMEQTLREIGNP